MDTTYLIKEETLTNIAEAIREKTGKSEQIKCSEFVKELSELITETDENVIEQCLSGDMEEVYINGFTQTIPSYFFQEFRTSSPVKMTFLKCTAINSGAFYRNEAITAAIFPECVVIGDEAFQFCHYLTNINFPKCNTIGNEAFYGCDSLSSITFPQCRTVGTSAFAGANGLTHISLPACTEIGPYTFDEDNLLTNVYLPKCATVGSSAFRYCSALTFISLPACEKLQPSTFYECASLSTIYLSKCSYIDASAFSYCSALSTIVLNSTSFVTLFGNLYNTPLYSGQGSIYISESLISNYTQDYYWKRYSKCFVPLSEYNLTEKEAT